MKHLTMEQSWWKCSVAALLLSGSTAYAETEPMFDIDLSTLTRLPLWEPTLEEYFPVQRGGEKNEQGLASPVVLTSPTREDFLRHARKGYPIMVSDWTKGMVYDGWTGEDFAKTFPFGWLKAEYIFSLPGFKMDQHKYKMMDGEHRWPMGSFKPDGKTMWYNVTRPARKEYQDDPFKPKTGPYVWHVKDELPAKQKKQVQARFEAPEFLNDDLNKDKMNTSFELWFSPGSEAGAGAHNDGYCQSVVSIQLQGDKRWRKQMLPEMHFLDSFDEFDGGVYAAGKWNPDLGFLNKRGGAVIWPPGYLHETSSVQDPDGKCAAAITLQYAFPQPVQFFRAFLPRLSLSSEVGHCGSLQWNNYVDFFIPGINPTNKMASMKEQLTSILRTIDVNKDDRMTVEEVDAWFHRIKPDAPLQPFSKELASKKYRDQWLGWQAEDCVAYHDMDGDMVVSKQELWDSLVQWNVVRWRIKQGLQYASVADREGLEDMEKSLDSFRRHPLKVPTKLREELQHLFMLEKGTKIMSPQKNAELDNFGDSWFSETRDRVEKVLNKQRKAKKQKKKEL
eukprot:TRINITY_DN12502_c1_g1_i1.p1 TRINITY_DN12502_c1_g1~~TRINITY_DN12502_c1_g1_i1.p1  ORF type:complete len:561 (+),score=119.75 TRINITY_DN12502_c1_g1_i1:54-1736(+)